MYPEYIDKIIARLEAAGERAYIVGGSLRDALLGITPHDYDVTTSALPQITARIFSDMRVIETGIKHGTVTVIFDGEPVEITTFRIDGSYTDSRHPDGVTFTSDIVADLARRDFTVNAMAYNKREGLIDPFGGAEDARRGIIRAVGVPQDRFCEDALRIMRAFRFSAQLGFEIEKNTLAGMSAAASGLENIARERIGNEFIRLITSPHPRAALELMAATDTLKYALREYSPPRLVIENIEAMPCFDVARLGFLLCGLERDSAEPILKGLRCSGRQITGALAVLTGSKETVSSAADARRLISKTGIYATYAAAASYLSGNSPSEAQSITAREASAPCRLQDLKINGKVLSQMGVRGKLIGEILTHLMDAVIADPSLNEESTLVSLAERMIGE